MRHAISLIVLLLLTSRIFSTSTPAIAAAPLASEPLPWLRAQGLDLVDSAGHKVVLQGFNLGGAFTVEIWQSAFNNDRSGTEFPNIRDEKTLWDVLTRRFGAKKTEQLRHTWRIAWANGKDVERLAALGCNVVRIPFWHRLLEDDADSVRFLPEGVKLLDNLVDACAANHVYAILDLHGAPGCQSKDHHSGEVDRNELWNSEKNRQRTAALWAAIARHYRDRPEVAGYDLLNEPMGAPDSKALIAVHDQILQAIRRVDRRHVIFVEDGYKGWSAFPSDPRRMGWTNVCYSLHHYRFDAKTPQTHYQSIRDELPKWRKQQEQCQVPLLIGEFSTIGKAAGAEQTMLAYFQAFNAYGWSWAAWEYKKLSDRDGRENIWGLYTNARPWDRPNPYKDSFDELQAKFAKYDTSNLVLQEGYAEAVKNGTGRAGKGK